MIAWPWVAMIALASFLFGARLALRIVGSTPRGAITEAIRLRRYRQGKCTCGLCR